MPRCLLELSPTLIRIECLHQRDKLTKSVLRKRSNLLVEENPVAERHQCRNRTDPERTSQSLFGLNAGLGEDNIGVVLGRRRLPRREYATGPTSLRLEVDGNDGMRLDGRCEV